MMGVLAPPELLGIHTNMLASFQPTSTEPPFRARRRQRVCQPMRNSLRPPPVRLSKGNRLRVPDGAAAAERCTELRIRPSAWPRTSLITTRAAWTHRSRLQRTVGGPHARRRSRQHHAHLADEHGDFWCPSLLGILGQGIFQCQRRFHPGRPSASSLTSSIRLRGVGPSGPIQPDPLQQVAQGGHFAAWEQPKFLSEEMRAGFRSLRNAV